MSLGALGPMMCSLTSLLSSVATGTAGSASARAVILSSLSGVAPGFLSSPGMASGFPGPAP